KGQTQRLYTGVFQGVRVILQKEGLRGLLAGLGTAVCNRASLQTPITQAVMRYAPCAILSISCLFPKPLSFLAARRAANRNGAYSTATRPCSMVVDWDSTSRYAEL